MSRSRCPRCGDKVRDRRFMALSRYDNKTMICSPCGSGEALAQWRAVPRTPQGVADAVDPYNPGAVAWVLPPRNIHAPEPEVGE